MSALYTILCIVLILISIALIIAVLLQQGQRQGLGAISGGAETFFGKNKANTVEAKLKKYTKIAAVAFIVLAIATTMVHFRIDNTATTAPTVEAAVEEAAETAETAVEEAAENTEAAVEEAAETVETAVEEAAETAEAAVEG